MLLTANPLLIDNALWITAFVLLVSTTIFAIIGPAIVRRFVPLERLRSNNEVAGFKFATVGVIYAVLLAFAILVVWERFNQADIGVANEASAAATVFRLTQGLDPAHGAAIRKATTDYLKAAVEKDWPAMERETSSRKSPAPPHTAIRRTDRSGSPATRTPCAVSGSAAATTFANS